MNPMPLFDAAAQAAHDGLHGLERQIDVPAPRRPPWQRRVLPALGTLLTLVGLILFFLPFTNLLIIAGLPLMFCFSRRWENAARTRMGRVLTTVRRWVAGTRRRWQR